MGVLCPPPVPPMQIPTRSHHLKPCRSHPRWVAKRSNIQVGMREEGTSPQPLSQESGAVPPHHCHSAISWSPPAPLARLPLLSMLCHAGLYSFETCLTLSHAGPLLLCPAYNTAPSDGARVHPEASPKSQHKGHLLKEAFPDHPGQRSPTRQPLSRRPVSLSLRASLWNFLFFRRFMRWSGGWLSPRMF